jgi:glycerol-3-phosphate dehydrogenase (NAD(P)+)
MGHVAVLGAGAWGTSLAILLAGKGERVTLWTWLEAHAERLRKERENAEFFRGFELPSAIRPTSDLAEALDGAELVTLVIPSHAFRDTLIAARPHLPADVPLVSATKGIENTTLMLMSEIIEDVVGKDAAERTACLSGPSFARGRAGRPPTWSASATSRSAWPSSNALLPSAAFIRDDRRRRGGRRAKNDRDAAGACDGLGCRQHAQH